MVMNYSRLVKTYKKLIFMGHYFSRSQEHSTVYCDYCDEFRRDKIL